MLCSVRSATNKVANTVCSHLYVESEVVTLTEAESRMAAAGVWSAGEEETGRCWLKDGKF